MLAASGALASCRLGSGTPPARTSRGQHTRWDALRLVYRRDASPLERAVLDDVAGLFERALGRSVPIVVEDASPSWGPLDIFVATRETPLVIDTGLAPARGVPGSYRIASAVETGPRWVVAGADAEGARNGIYRLLERLGFGFFIDSDTVPALATVPAPETTDVDTAPAFSLRGEMIWDFYFGPRRFCAATWGEAEWERALLYLARKGHDFVEFYPPLEHVLHQIFPEASELAEGRVWRAESKHRMMQRVLARGRALGLRFMYVLTYGQFPAAIRRIRPELAWAGDYLCAHQPELRELTRRVWRTLVQELGTDHVYAVRHRGEEGQSYSDPCRSVTKPEGLRQAIGVLEEIDPMAEITVWTWAEKVPELFRELPAQVTAVHVRHGMGKVFADRGEGREQRDGAPPLPDGRRWMSAQFTVFSASECQLQTAWSDANALARDARAAARDPACAGYFHWPEWTGSSPWLNEVIARLAWDPDGFSADAALEEHAHARHGAQAERFLHAFRPLLRLGNARFMTTPRKRCLVPWYLAGDQLDGLAQVRAGLARAVSGLGGGLDAGALSPALARDLVDVVVWTATRQAHVHEAAAYLHHLAGDMSAARPAMRAAATAWETLRALLASMPDRSLLATARDMAREAPLGAHATRSFFELGCDFYHGYPLVMSPEAIELVHAVQSRALGEALESHATRGQRAALEAAGWFWHDFPDPRWAACVRVLPREDAATFAAEMTRRLDAAFAQGTAERSTAPRQTHVAPAELPDVDHALLARTVSTLASLALPSPLADPPVDIP